MRRNGSGQNISAQARGLNGDGARASVSKSDEPVPFQAQQRDRAILPAARSGRRGVSSQAEIHFGMGNRRGLARSGGFGSVDVFSEPAKTLTAALDPTFAVASIQANSMKFFRLIVIFAAVFCAGLPLRAELADAVKAVVSDSVITLSQVELSTQPAVEALQRQYPNDPEIFKQKLNDALNDSLEQLVERQLILRSFETEGYQLPDSYVDQMVQDRIRGIYGDRITFIKTMQAEGKTAEQFRKEVRDQYIITQLRLKNVSQAIVISPYKVETYYLAHQDDFKMEDEIKLRMIVLNKSSADDTNTVKLADEILAKIKEGATFEEMASVYSQGSQQHQGGDWGWVERSVLRKDLAAAAFALKPGQVSDVIETPESDYIMLVEQVRPAHVRPLNEIRDDIEKTLRAQEQARLEKQWIDGLKKKTFIRYF
jgi:peptidyl-prolyl cis-trans isomerase SurA